MTFTVRGISQQVADDRVPGLSCTPCTNAELEIAKWLARAGTAWLHLRHAEAGCYIARVDRVA